MAPERGIWQRLVMVASARVRVELTEGQAQEAGLSAASGYRVSGMPLVPKGYGVGLSLYKVARELQLLLAVWTGACPICHRNTPELIST
ncbi:hypothetical protein ACWEGQ_02805 [Streptomyces seoulensis]